MKYAIKAPPVKYNTTVINCLHICLEDDIYTYYYCYFFPLFGDVFGDIAVSPHSSTTFDFPLRPSEDCCLI